MTVAVDEPKQRRVRVIHGVALAAIVALGVAPFVADGVRAGRVPDEGAIARATAAIRSDFQDGDAVWVNPSWYTLPWHGLEEMGAGTEAWPYPALLMSEDLDPLEALSHARLWVLAAFAREPDPPEVIADVVTGRVDIEVEGGVEGNVALARYDLPRLERLRTLSRDNERLVVKRVPASGGEGTTCRFRGERHRCNKEAWLDLHLQDRIVYHRQVQWLMAHPGPDEERLEITWKDLPSDGTWLFLRAGWTMEAVRHKDGSETHVSVLVDGQEIDAFALAPRRYWMERRAYRLSGEDVDVTLRVHAAEIGYRELMVEADVLPELPGPLRRWATFVRE